MKNTYPGTGMKNKIDPATNMRIGRALSQAVRQSIAADYSDDQPFTVLDFHDQAKQFGKSAKSAMHILRDMDKKGLIRVVGEQVNVHGGGNTKRYVKVPGAIHTPKTGPDYQRELVERSNLMRLCANNLQAALDLITRRSLA